MVDVAILRQVTLYNTLILQASSLSDSILYQILISVRSLHDCEAIRGRTASALT